MYTVDNMVKASKKLGEKLKYFRLQNGMSQLDLALKLKVDKSFISNIENGKNNPTLNTIEKIAMILNVPLSELFN